MPGAERKALRDVLEELVREHGADAVAEELAQLHSVQTMLNLEELHEAAEQISRALGIGEENYGH